jgi:hypothetical protein
MSFITAAPTVTLPAIERGQLWRDEVLDITYRTLTKARDGWHVRCIGAAGTPWLDVMPFECFTTELALVN